MIDLYTDSSPNGFKATIAIEELALPYRLCHVSIERGEHQRPHFLKLNPHGRIPVIVDNECGITLFESAAILLYLADKTGRLLPAEPKARWEAIKWLQFHASSMGPILGQRVHFEMFADEKIPAAINRYQKLTEDTFTVLDKRLEGNPWLAGDDYSVADIATFGWTHIAEICGFNFSHHQNLSRWHEEVGRRPAVQRGISLPAPATGP
ncbi:glutathione S-transferase N-terminal domain-containing protein [Ochrobactrum vermis]|uniref:Glutathione S-transferase N-terminal domain-containing protein n=1 Tax=Ochrobactrum vermis TaxID=1827297 RepID=A0ABU8PFW3_9HYPH|nr:glutathione S-transferase N-terminal domain-containing protein [Ochrobactrum vermis]PQZ25526.1 glutathione S-transferase [Ochrobactrum vermis]